MQKIKSNKTQKIKRNKKIRSIKPNKIQKNETK